MAKRIIAASVVLVLMASCVLSDVPQLINFQGKLYDSEGNPLSGEYELIFRIYTLEEGGRHDWSEINSVVCEDGLYSVILGQVTPLNLDFNMDYWLGVRVSGDDEMQPRYRLVSVPYAFRAAVADSVIGGGGGDGVDSDWQVSGDNMYAVPSGNVGIGVLNPGYKLDVGNRMRVSKGNSNSAGIWFAHESLNPENRAFVGLASDTSVGFWGNTGAGFKMVMNTTNGNVGVSMANPQYRLHVEGADMSDPVGFFKNNIIGGDGIGVKGECTVVDGAGIGGMFQGGTVGAKGMVSPTGSEDYYGLQGMVMGGSGTNYGVYGSAILGSTNWGGYFIGDGYFSGSVGIGTGTPTERLDVNGTVKTEVLKITGGADLSEQFDVSSNIEPQPGMVVCIDDSSPGKLIVSEEPYDRKVAGIISGAGGVHPGMLMGQSGSMADGSHPVALTGRVYCLADAAHGSIIPGDLLTTSSTPGHVMKVTDYERAQGAIIGKAMSPLEDDRGLILVLVSLQ